MSTATTAGRGAGGSVGEAAGEAARRHLANVNAILAAHGYRRSELIAILQAVQEEYRYLPQEVLAYVATALGIAPASVYGVATFYAQFSLEPKGEYVVRICDGTACHVKDSQLVLDAVRKKVGLSGGRATTPDGRFTVETVACLGACGLAPVMVINGQVHGQLTAEAAETILETILNRQGDEQ